MTCICFIQVGIGHPEIALGLAQCRTLCFDGCVQNFRFTGLSCTSLIILILLQPEAHLSRSYSIPTGFGESESWAVGVAASSGCNMNYEYDQWDSIF